MSYRVKKNISFKLHYLYMLISAFMLLLIWGISTFYQSILKPSKPLISANIP